MILHHKVTLHTMSSVPQMHTAPTVYVMLSCMPQNQRSAAVCTILEGSRQRTTADMGLLLNSPGTTSQWSAVCSGPSLAQYSKLHQQSSLARVWQPHACHAANTDAQSGTLCTQARSARPVLCAKRYAAAVHAFQLLQLTILQQDPQLRHRVLNIGAKFHGLV